MTADGHRESDDEWAARVTRAVRAGSREALAEIYDRCADEVVSWVQKTTHRDESFALDCLQEMFMRLAAHPPIAETHAALVTWMRVTALNLARNTIVAEARRAQRERGRLVDESSSRAADADEPVESLLARLDAEKVELLRLRHVEGMRVKAVARALGATPHAVESALRRLVARLRDGGVS